MRLDLRKDIVEETALAKINLALSRQSKHAALMHPADVAVLCAAHQEALIFNDKRTIGPFISAEMDSHNPGISATAAALDIIQRYEAWADHATKIELASRHTEGKINAAHDIRDLQGALKDIPWPAVPA